MRQYFVYRMEYESDEPEYIAVKDGFSFPAFFFGILWFLKKRLWKWSLAYLGFWVLELVGMISYAYWFFFLVVIFQILSGTFDAKHYSDKQYFEGILAIFKKLSTFVSYFLALAAGAFLGVESNGILRNKLVEDGYDFIGIFEGSRNKVITKAMEQHYDTE